MAATVVDLRNGVRANFVNLDVSCRSGRFAAWNTNFEIWKITAEVFALRHGLAFNVDNLEAGCRCGRFADILT